MNKLITTCLTFLGLAHIQSAHAVSIPLEDIDLSNVVDNGQIIFAPLKETSRNRGVLWFRDYAQRVYPPIGGTWDLRKISIYQYPVSTNEEINSFLQENSASDARSISVSEGATLCEPSEALVEYMEGLNIYYELRVTGPRYPGLCGLDIRYVLQEDVTAESKIYDFVSNNHVADIEFSITETSADPIMIQVPDIIQLLIDKGVLESTPDGRGLNGDAREVVFYSSRMDESLYGLEYGQVLEYEHWSHFYKLFEVNELGENTIPMTDTVSPIEVSKELENPLTFTIEVK